MPEDEKGLVIKENTLILPKGFDLSKPLVIKYQDEFEKARRTYSGEISIEFKEAEADISSSKSEGKDDKAKHFDNQDKLISNNVELTPETGDNNVIHIYAFLLVCILGLMFYLKKKCFK